MAPAHEGIFYVRRAVQLYLQAVFEVLEDRAVNIDANQTQSEAIAAVLTALAVVFVGTDDVAAELGHGGNIATFPLGFG